VEKRLKDLEDLIKRQNEVIQRLQDSLDKLQKPAEPVPPVTPAPTTPMPPPPRSAPSAGVPPALPPTPAAPATDAFVVQSRNGDFRMRFRGIIQSDARFFPTEGGRTGNEAFLMRRARLTMAGTVGRYAEFMLQPVFDEGRANILDAFVDVRQGPQLQFRFGLFKAPFSLERLQPAQDLLFVERSLAQNFAPNRDTGVMLHGETLKGRLSYAAAVVNGAPDTANSYGDTGRGKDFAGRIFARPFMRRRGSFGEGLGLGLATTYGSRDEAFQSTFRTASREPFFLYRSDVKYGGEVIRLAPQLYHYYRQFGLMGEAYLTRETVSRGGVTAPLDNYGWFLQGSYVVTGENATFQTVRPRKPFDPSRGHWGALELAFRYSQFRADREAFTRGFVDPAVAARSADAWTVGANWYLNPWLKFQLNYERTNFGTPLLFRTGMHDHEDVFLTRFQLAY
jgi:phosphate-selective porin OprO/OprP